MVVHGHGLCRFDGHVIKSETEVWRCELGMSVSGLVSFRLGRGGYLYRFEAIILPRGGLVFVIESPNFGTGQRKTRQGFVRKCSAVQNGLIAQIPGMGPLKGWPSLARLGFA
jgi:hypothetical protein